MKFSTRKMQKTNCGRKGKMWIRYVSIISKQFTRRPINHLRLISVECWFWFWRQFHRLKAFQQIPRETHRLNLRKKKKKKMLHNTLSVKFLFSFWLLTLWLNLFSAGFDTNLYSLCWLKKRNASHHPIACLMNPMWLWCDILTWPI